jgi:hypothetical protein
MNHLDNPGLHLSVTYMVVKYSMIFLEKESWKNKRKTLKNLNLMLSSEIQA